MRLTLLRCRSVLTLATALAVGAARGAAADSFIDEQVSKETSGIYRAQDALPIALGAVTAGCALLYGSADRFGRTCWKAGEAAVGSYALAKGLQSLTNRESPEHTDDPSDWNAHGSGSFPSGHVAFTTALVTPFVLEYASERPWVTALLLLPAYEMVARVKAREHWQTDVLAGALLGFAVGAIEQRYDGPFALALLPNGALLSYSKAL